MNEEKFLSICIPSYNRPKELRRLLDSIDASNTEEIEIVIREDQSPKRQEIREVVHKYIEGSKYTVHYIENERNYGYDKNIRKAAKVANGIWIMFMGDDDVFVKKSLDRYIQFLKKHSQLGYVLRRYRAKYISGVVEEYRYANKNVLFPPGEKTIIELFRRSLFISGFAFRKACFTDYDCDEYDGTLLFQIYIQSYVCLKNSSAYCDVPITQSIEGGVPYFGVSESEKGLYETEKNTLNSSINFLKQVKILSESFDNKYHTNITVGVLKSYSKYSYGYLHEHRDNGIKVFNKYAKEIKKIGMGDSGYFYIYYVMLLVLGKKNSQKVIRIVKKILGRTPKL